MQLASAYPNSAISAGAMVAIALVAAGSLAFWLVMVFVADRQRRALSVRPSHTPAADLVVPEPRQPALAGPDETTEDELTEAGHGDATRRIQPVGW